MQELVLEGGGWNETNRHLYQLRLRLPFLQKYALARDRALS